MKTLLKLAVAALVIYACWQAGSVYLRYYQFKDEVQQTALFGAAKSDSELHKVIMDIANRMQVPLAPENVSVRRGENHVMIDAAYTEKIQLVPTYYYPYDFKVKLDVLTMGPGSIAPIR